MGKAAEGRSFFPNQQHDTLRVSTSFDPDVTKWRSLMKRKIKLIAACVLGAAVIVLAIQYWPRDVRLKATYRGHKEDVQSLDFHPDGKIVASGSRDGVRVWELHTLRELWRTTNWTPWNRPATVKFLPPDKLMYSDNSRGIVIVETSGWTEQQELGPISRSIVATASPNGRWIAGYFVEYPIGADGLVNTHNFTLCKLIVFDRAHPLISRESDTAQMPAAFFSKLANESLLISRELDTARMGEVRSLAFHPTLPHVVAIGTKASDIRSWNVETGDTLHDFPWPYHRESVAPPMACAFSPSGDRIHTPTAVISYPSGEFEQLRHPTRPRYFGNTLAVSTDGRRIATAQPDGKGNGLITLWNTETNSSSLEFTAVYDGGIASMCFSPDGRSLAVGGAPRTGWDRGLRLLPWDRPDHSVKVWQIAHD